MSPEHFPRPKQLETIENMAMYQSIEPIHSEDEDSEENDRMESLKNRIENIEMMYNPRELGRRAKRKKKKKFFKKSQNIGEIL